jgi:hypothetical protein
MSASMTLARYRRRSPAGNLPALRMFKPINLSRIKPRLGPTPWWGFCCRRLEPEGGLVVIWAFCCGVEIMGCAMSVLEDNAVDVSRAAYEISWAAFQGFRHLTPDEKARGSERLRDYISTLVIAGERDAEKIARSALGLIRQYEQILQSQVRVDAGTTRLGYPP